MQSEIDRIVEATKDILARWDREHERYGEAEIYFEEDEDGDLIATTEPPHTCVFHWVEMCQQCGRQPSYYRRSERVNVSGDVL